MLRFAPRLTAVTLASTIMLASDASAAKPVTVSGAVEGGKGMTVMALGPSGAAVRERAGAGGRFKFKLSAAQARGATLQLLDAGGQFVGPVVLSGKGRKLYLALSGRSVVVGPIARHDGYARARKSVTRSALDRKQTVVGDAKGKPIGAGKLGLVRVGGGNRRASAAGTTPGGDGDRDGVADIVDIDANGNRVIDRFDPKAAQSAGLFSTLYTSLGQSLNVNAAGVTATQIDSLISGEGFFNLIFHFDEGYVRGRTIRSAHVDCGTLSYCQRGSGSATISGVSESGPSLPRGTRWVDYTPDGSGLPNLEQITSHDRRNAYAMSIAPRATTAQLRPGNTFDVVFNTDGARVHFPTVLSPYFVTTPALASYSSGGAETGLDYREIASAPGANHGNPAVLESGKVKLTFWRPQRQAVPGAEAGEYYDLGRLHYGVVPNTTEPGSSGGGPEFGCKGFFSDMAGGLVDGPTTRDTFADELSPMVDEAADALPDPARKLSFTLDVAGCLRAHGVDPASRTVSLGLTAAGEVRPGGSDRAVQSFVVKLPG